MKTIGLAVFGLLIGILLLAVFIFVGMSITNDLIAWLIIGAVAFLLYVPLGLKYFRKYIWVSPTFSAIPALAITTSEIGRVALTYYTLAGVVWVSSLAGAYVGARLCSNNRLERSRVASSVRQGGADD